MGSEDLPVGEKIKRLREGASLTVEQLAASAGLSITELENIEQDMISPALGTLTKICDGLGVRLGHFFDQGPRKLFALVRASDEKVATRFASKAGADHGFEYESLGSEKRQRVMEPFYITITPPSDHSGQPTAVETSGTHAGEEFIYVLEGEIQVDLEDQSFILAPGDSLYYDASIPHRVLLHGDKPAKVLAVIHLPRGE
jgi:transcriptional regulator with XRE-family HTH domain